MADELTNQCDGCLRRLPLRDGFHRDKRGWVVMGCTKEKYDQPAPQREKEG